MQEIFLQEEMVVLADEAGGYTNEQICTDAIREFTSGGGAELTGECWVLDIAIARRHRGRGTLRVNTLKQVIAKGCTGGFTDKVLLRGLIQLKENLGFVQGVIDVSICWGRLARGT